MKIKRFMDSDMRHVLRRVRAEQGPDAVILSNRRVDGGIEVITAIDYDEALIQQALGSGPQLDETRTRRSASEADADADVAEEVEVVKVTTGDDVAKVNPLFSAEEILNYQHVIRRIPVADNVVEYAVKMVAKTRPDSNTATDLVKQYIDWGAGPRASQNLILAAKTHAAIKGKFSPDIEDVQVVANPILRHRIIKNYKAEAEGISDEQVIESLF